MASENLDFILGGGPIEEFASNQPTTGEVLRFYSKFWRINVSDTVKQSRVARALTDFYSRRNIDTLKEFTFRKTIRTQVLSLKNIPKFKTKENSQKNIALENQFRAALSTVFQVQKGTHYSEGSTSMDTDNLVDYMEGSILL